MAAPRGLGEGRGTGSGPERMGAGRGRAMPVPETLGPLSPARSPWAAPTPARCLELTQAEGEGRHRERPSCMGRDGGRGTQGSGRGTEPPLPAPHSPKPEDVWRRVAGLAPALDRFLPFHNSAARPAAPAQPPGTDLASPRAGHRGPEEAPPVRVLEDVGQHAGEQAAAVQDDLLLLLRTAAALGSLHQLLHGLREAEGTLEGGAAGSRSRLGMGTRRATL